jgi:hypothetical protein
MSKPRSKEADAHYPAQLDKLTIYAIRAMNEGQASSAQQKRFIEWLLWEACRVHDVSYRPNDPYATAFAEGRRFPGIQYQEALVPETLKRVEELAAATAAQVAG